MSVEIDLSGANIPGLPKKMEIKNAAQEETLKEILKLMQQQQKTSEKSLKAIEKGAANSKGAGTASTSTGAKANEQAQEKAAKAANNNASGMKKTGISLGIMSAAVIRNAAVLNTLAVSSADLVRAFSSVGDSLDSATRQLGKIPFVGTLLEASLGAVAGAADDVYKSYLTLASSGATFDGSMRDMVKSATGAGLTFDQFAGLLAKNSQSLRLLGGTTEAGAKRFSELSKSMRTSGLNDGLLKMGYTTEEVNQGMLRYIDNFGRGGAAQNMTTEQLTQSSADYLTEIDALAKITGATRAEKQKELDDIARDTKFRAATAKLSAEDRAMLAKHIASFPEAAQAGVKDMIATGTATTDAAKKQNAMMSGSSQEAMRIGQTLRRGGKITQEQLDQNRKHMIDDAKIGRIRYQDQGIYNEKMREAYGAMDDIAQLDINGREKAAKEQEAIVAQTEALATTLGKLKQDIAGVGNKFALALLDDAAIESLRFAFKAMSDFVMAFVVPVFKLTIAVLNPFITIIGGVAKILSFVLGPTLNALADMIGLISGTISKVLNPVFDTLAQFGEKLTPVFGILGAAIGLLIAPFVALFSPVLALVAGITLAGTAIYAIVKYWDSITGVLSSIGNLLKAAFGFVLDSIKSAASKLNPLNWFKSDKKDASRTTESYTVNGKEVDKDTYNQQMAGMNKMTKGLDILNQTNKTLNETLEEGNELSEDQLDQGKDKNKSKPSSPGRPASGNAQAGQTPSATPASGSAGRPSARGGSIADDIQSMTPSGGGSGPSSDSPGGGGGKTAPSAGGGKDGASVGKKSGGGGRDGGPDASGGGGGGGAKPQSTGRPTGRGGTMSEEDTKAMIIDHEGIRYEPYKDSVGLWTVGVGHLIGDGKTLPDEYNRKFSHEEVMAMFEKDYEKHKKQAQTNVPGFSKFDSLGQAALVDLTFNMGPGWPRKFKNTSKKLAAGDTHGAADGLTNSKWYGQVGRRAPIITGMVRDSKVSARDGGVFDGPKSGYPATLHGEEAVVPLKGGNIPVEMGGNASQAEMINLLSTLNSKMDQLVSINAAIADLNNSQLRAQKKMGNNELLV